MRNYFAIAFTSVYLILTVGVAKTTHYCMGRLNTSALYSFEASKCICSNFETTSSATKSCCSDKHELITLDDDQQGSVVAALSLPDFFVIHTLFSGLEDHSFADLEKETGPSDGRASPPAGPPLFKLHCSLVFYS